MASSCRGPRYNPHDISTLTEEEFAKFSYAEEHSVGDPSMLHYARLLDNLTACCKTLSPSQSLHIDSCYARCIAERSSMPGMCYLGQLFADGAPPLPRNPAQANFFYARCAEGNNCILARYLLACNIELGNGIEMNPALASQLFQQVTDVTGLPCAMYRLARLLDRGADRLPQDSARAVRLFIRVIKKESSTDAMDCLAEMYAEGRPGVPRCLKSAYHLYERSVREEGGSRALVGLAFLLQNGGSGLEKDIPRAVDLYEAAIAKDENPHAYNNLAWLLSQGTREVDRDVNRAVVLWEAAVAKGNKYAKRNLARVLESGDENVERDRRRAVQLYAEVVDDERFKDVRFNLAWLLSSNLEDVPQDAERAATLYGEIISEESNVNAMFNLACLLSEGTGNLQQDYGRAIMLFERAISEGDHVYSMHTLGALLSSGRTGMKKDIPRAIQLLEKAVEKGRKEAIFDLAVALSSGDEVHKANIDMAVKRYEEAIDELDHMGAIINLAEILCDGKHGVEMDAKRAVNLCERAIAQGLNYDACALSNLGISLENVPAARTEAEVVVIRQHAVGQRWHLVAMCNLGGTLLSQENCTAEDLDKAMMLFEAANIGSQFPRLSQAQHSRFEDTFKILKDMVRGPKSGVHAKKAVRIYELLINGTENAHAMCLLAEVFLSGGNEVPQDVDRAVSLYKRAIRGGEKNAMMILGEMVSSGTHHVKVDKRYGFELFAQVISEGGEDHLVREAAVNMALLLSNHTCSSLRIV